MKKGIFVLLRRARVLDARANKVNSNFMVYSNPAVLVYFFFTDAIDSRSILDGVEI